MDKSKAKNKLIKHYFNLCKNANKKGIPVVVIRKVLLQTLGKDELIKESEGSRTDGLNCKRLSSKKNLYDQYNQNKNFSKRLVWNKFTFAVFFLIGLVTTPSMFDNHELVEEIFQIDSWRCIVENNAVVSEMTRPLVPCIFCSNLSSISVEYNISLQKFRTKYAYTSVPVLIKNATLNWSAMEIFSYQYLKDLYSGIDGALESVDEECQFFHYNTEFDNLTEVFNMTESRANLAEGEKPWYIGWSNCNNEVKNELRNHYERPYFLPNDSESSALDWIFMGGSGPGALIHLDYVQRPSWQAQISGKKTWTLLPPPECEIVCKAHNVTVHKGDIFVIDTNVWYHSTFIHPGEISITIGSEYD